MTQSSGAGSSRRRVRRSRTTNCAGALAELPSEPDVLTHRVVHGGEQFREAVRIDDSVLAELRSLTALAPLHQPKSMAGIESLARALSGTPAAACFDTAFHATLSRAAATYALPRAWRERHGLRRYGFHGLSHAYAARRAADLAPRSDRLVSCHLGAGASLCAVLEGRSIDTTMGFTPLEGLCMATRSGSVDPGMLLWLQEREELSPADTMSALEHESGLLGLSGTADMRELLGPGRRRRGACRGRLRASPAGGHRRDGRHARRHGRPAVHGRRR